MRIYTASTLGQAEMWRCLAEQWMEHEFVARWVSHHVGNVPDDEAFAKAFWDQDLEDVSDADVLIVYAQGEDHLRGALVEVGCALALGVPVIAVGSHPDYGTWQHHAGVYRVKYFEEAYTLIKVLSTPRYTMTENY
jgi:nucleoside 2-deoxyribosyltransferase